MSTAIAKNFQVGNDSTATNNFTIRQPATPDGTVRIANGNTGTTTDLVTVTSAGNVGIGTSSPSNATLDVVANANTVALAVRGRSSDNLSGIVFRSNNAATEYAYLQGGATYLAVGVNAAERMRVDGLGNLMIGGTAAYGKTTSYTNFGNAHASSYTARALGTAQGQLAGYSFNPTFQGTADNGPRRAADIWSGFNGGAWTTEFLAFGVGTGAVNDAGNATTERMRITGSGNVGIGTSSPTATLDVSGNVAITGSARRITGDFSNATVANRVLFQSSTGTFTDIGALGPNASQSAAWTAYFGNDPTNTSRTRMLATSIDGRFESGITGTGTYLPMTFWTGGSERVRIDSSGNVGIGTSSPDEKLVVSGAITTTAQAAANKTSAGTVDFYATDNATRILSWGASGVGGSISFWTGSGGSGTLEKARITSGGDLLVGRTTSNGRLSIQGGGNTSATNSVSVINSAGSNIIYLRDDRQIFADGISSGAGTYALKWQASGQFTYDTSSARYKDNIRDSQYGLDAVMSLRSRMFEYKNDGRTDIGLVAEEVDAVIPELVPKDKEGRPDAVSYDRMVSVLIQAIQELKAEFDAYKATHP